MKNENGQLVLVSASQTVLQQNTSSNSVVTTVAQGAGYRIQNVRVSWSFIFVYPWYDY